MTGKNPPLKVIQKKKKHFAMKSEPSDICLELIQRKYTVEQWNV